MTCCGQPRAPTRSSFEPIWPAVAGVGEPADELLHQAGRQVDGQARLEVHDHIGPVQELIGDQGWHLVRAVDAKLGQGGMTSLTVTSGAVPADSTLTVPPARWAASPAASCDRPALCLQTNKTVGRRSPDANRDRDGGCR